MGVRMYLIMYTGLSPQDFDLSTGLDQLHKEYQSVKTLLDRYTARVLPVTCTSHGDRGYSC